MSGARVSTTMDTSEDYLPPPPPPEGFAALFRAHHSPDQFEYFNFFHYYLEYVNYLMSNNKDDEEVSRTLSEQSYSIVGRPDIDFLLSLPSFESLYNNYKDGVGTVLAAIGTSVRYQRENGTFCVKQIFKNSLKKRKLLGQFASPNRYDILDTEDAPRIQKTTQI